MIKTQQVKKSVNDQNMQLVKRAVTRGLRLRGRDGGAQHNVAQNTLGEGLVLSAWAQFIHRKTQHIGGSWFIHPGDVEL